MEAHPKYCVRYPLANMVIKAPMSPPAREMPNSFILSSGGAHRPHKEYKAGNAKPWQVEGKNQNNHFDGLVERLEQIQGSRTTRKFDEMLIMWNTNV